MREIALLSRVASPPSRLPSRVGPRRRVQKSSAFPPQPGSKSSIFLYRGVLQLPPRYWLFLLSFVITAFGQPAWVAPLGYFAAALGFALFWKGLLEVGEKKRRFWIATFWFTLVEGVQLSWLATPDYMGWLIVPFTLILSFGIGLQFGILSHFVTFPLSWGKLLAIAGGWVICEWLRLFFLCGYTWNPSGLALASSPYSLQLASIWGIFGLSFWVILVNLAFLKAWCERSFRQTAYWAGLALFPYLFGWVQIAWVESHTPIQKTLDVALIQTNLSPEEKEFDPQFPHSYISPIRQWANILSALEGLAGKKRADLIIFPEAALPLGAHTASYDLETVKYFFDESFFPPFRRPYAIFHDSTWKVSNAFLAQSLANRFGADVIIGLDDVDFEGRYNAAFHFAPSKLTYQRYEKQILAPIAEYIPLKNWSRFARFLAKQYGIYGSFDPGKEGKIFNSHVPIGISICLEETFSNLIRALRLKGAEVLVSVSNDAYFPNTKLSLQHFHHGRIRAVENGVPLLRSTNSGVTGGVDCFGRPLQILDAKKNTSALFFSMPIRSYSTLYTFWGDLAILVQSTLLIASFALFSLKLDLKKLP